MVSQSCWLCVVVLCVVVLCAAAGEVSAANVMGAVPEEAATESRGRRGEETK